MSNTITLFPSNWLYNAGVIGFLRVLERCGENVEGFLKDDGSVGIDSNIIKRIISEDKPSHVSSLSDFFIWHWHFVDETFKYAYSSLEEYIVSEVNSIKEGKNKSSIKNNILKGLESSSSAIEERIKDIFKRINKNSSKTQLYQASKELVEAVRTKKDFFIYRKAVGYLFSKNQYYQNLFNPSNFKRPSKFVELFEYGKIFNLQSSPQEKCSLCLREDYETFPIDLQFMSYLFPASSFPNSYWNMQTQSIIKICSLCKFLIVHHHIALTKLSDGSQILINAPSFKLMWHLNNYARKQSEKPIREILGMSLIELAVEQYKLLGKWEKMNIEVVSKYTKVKPDGKPEVIIDFFSLPYEIVDLLSDKEIASMINRIGELSVLNYVLDGRFDRILWLGEKVMRKALTIPEGKISKDKFVEDNIKLQKFKRNTKTLLAFANKLFRLYTLIGDKMKKEVGYGL